MYWAIQLCLCYGPLSIFQLLSLFVWPTSLYHPLILLPLGNATLPGPLPVSPPLGFNLAAAKTAGSELGTTDSRKTNGKTEVKSLCIVQPPQQ